MERATEDAVDPTMVRAFKALASDKRLQILQWLADPRAHFPEQRDGDLVADGVCGLFLAEKLGVSQPTLHQHMKLLVGCGLVRATKIKQWTFYAREDAAIAAIARALDGLR